jgi:hypothetical protein
MSDKAHRVNQTRSVPLPSFSRTIPPGAAIGAAAPFRERAVETVVEHLGALSARHGTRFFYLPQDSVAPKTLGRLADARFGFT